MSEPFIGQIMPVGFNFPPRGWALCDGQILPIAQNTALFSLLGTTFGGDGRVTFALPDLRGRTSLHVGTGAGLSPVTWGERGGSENSVLNVNNLASHNHAATAKAVDGPGNTNVASGNVWSSDAGMASATYSTAMAGGAMRNGAVEVANTGSSSSFTNLPPYLGLYWCIALVGVFPSRS